MTEPVNAVLRFFVLIAHPNASKLEFNDVIIPLTSNAEAGTTRCTINAQVFRTRGYDHQGWTG